jgi:hypothetical protein
MAVRKVTGGGRVIQHGGWPRAGANDAHCESEPVNAAPAPERMNSPLEIREVRLRGLHRNHLDGWRASPPREKPRLPRAGLLDGGSGAPGRRAVERSAQADITFS